jgi:hypothetical protein
VTAKARKAAGLRDVQIIVFVLGSKGFNQDICLEFTCASYSYSSKLDMGCTAHEVDAKVRLSNVESFKSDIGIETYGVRVEIMNAINHASIRLLLTF